MAVVKVQSNGNAPSGLKAGDYVDTAGGMYQIVSPGSVGASYNASSGYWSVPVGSTNTSNPSSTSSISQMMNTAAKIAAENSDKSQSYAREQMQFQTESNAKAMQFSADEAQKNRDWQEQMSNTAHQREVNDLIAAGLNPVLSANQGASVGSGATASGVTSAGASGSVDTSQNNLIANLFSQLLQRQTTLDVNNIQRQTSLDIAKLQAQVNAYMADSSRAATLGAAATSAAGALQVAGAYNDYNKWQVENYPGTMWQSLFNAINGAVNGSSNSSSGVLNAVNKLWSAFSGSGFRQMSPEFRKWYVNNRGK